MGTGNGNGSGRLNGDRNLNWGQDHLVGCGSCYGCRKMERVQEIEGIRVFGKGTGSGNGYRTWNG